MSRSILIQGHQKDNFKVKMCVCGGEGMDTFIKQIRVDMGVTSKENKHTLQGGRLPWSRYIHVNIGVAIMQIDK